MNRITHRTVSILAVGSIALAACGGDDDAEPAAEPADPAAPADTTAAPADTTAAPADTTAAPADTTAAPADTTAAPADTTMAPADTTAAPADTTMAPADSPLITLAETDLGEVIVAADGLTLYMFEPDAEGEATCTGDCAAQWPPYYVDEGVDLTAGDGLDPALLGAVAHPEGGTMLTYGDWPLYYFAGDRDPGDVNGQGVNDVWWVVDASGTPLDGTTTLPDDEPGYGFYDY